MPPEDADTFTVRQLNQLIRYALSVTFPDQVWVEGEISSLNRHAGSGHVYFQLVDADDDASGADSSLPVVLYRDHRDFVNRLIKRAHPLGAMKMDDGVRIRIRGAIDYFPRQGRLQLRMTSIDPTYTLGRLALERDRVLAALRTEGLADRNRRHPIPLLPVRVGLVTSEGSAAEADFLHELERSGIGWQVVVASVRVQGPGAEREIVAGLRAVERRRPDVIALVRGGGARTDLMPFDAEPLARAIAGLSVPVLTGIGHEIDTSVADLVAAEAHKTPTACAAALVDRARTAIDRAEGAWAGVVDLAPARVDGTEAMLDRTAHRVATATRLRLDGHAQRLAALDHRLRRSAPTIVTTAERHVEALAWRVAALDPQRALARGWSITRDADGHVVRDPAAVAGGNVLVTTVAGGTIRSEVVEGAP